MFSLIISFPTTPIWKLFEPLQTYTTRSALEGTDYDNEFKHIADAINDIYSKTGALPLANIQALRDVQDPATYSSTTDVPREHGQTRTVIGASDGTYTRMAEYKFDANSATADADGAAVDTDGIVSPTSGTGRWFRTGFQDFIANRGTIARRTLFNSLGIDLNTDSIATDAAIILTKRAAGSQIKILTNEEIAIRNAADSAYEDIACLGATLAGNLIGAGTDNDLTGAPPATETDSLLGLGIDIVGGSANGTYLGINTSSFSGNFIDFQVAGTSKAKITYEGNILSTGNNHHFSGQPIASTTEALIRAINALSSGHASGTVLGANASNGYVGDLVNFQVNNSTRFKIDYTGRTKGANAVSNDEYTTLSQVTSLSSAAVVFNPLFLPNLTLWLKADAITGLVDNDLVATWTDSSGRKETFTEATNKPTYKTSIINGKPVVRFDGTNDILTSSLAISNFITNSAYTFFLVVKTPSSHPAGETVFGVADANIYFDDSAANSNFSLFTNNGPTVFLGNYDGTQDTAQTGTFTNGNSLIIDGYHSGGNIGVRKNAGSYATQASGNTSDLTGTLKLAFDGTNYGQFDIAELIIYNTTLTALDTTRILNYLNDKYAVY